MNVDDRLYLLNEDEIKAIRIRERIAIWISAVIGGSGVLFLYIPYYLFPGSFPSIKIVALGKTVELPVLFLTYSVFLVGVELFILTMLNIWCVHEVAVATGFLDHKSKRIPEKRNLLLDIGLEKKNRQVLTYGIDPLHGLNRSALVFWNLMFMLKATLTNMFSRFLIQRVMGRYVIRAVQDLAGIPIFAFWNAYATRTILKEARVIIMGQNLIEELMNKMRISDENIIEERALLSDTMQFVAVSKRDFHQNHYVLTRNLFEHFGIDERKGAWHEEAFLEKLRKAGKSQREKCILLILMGLILDGKISSREKKRIRKLNGMGLIPYDEVEMSAFTDDFIGGKGIESLFERYLGKGDT